jgi:predicted Rossmann fold nucleotide-binding protein DprA/Smf involved in DNA uptake
MNKLFSSSAPLTLILAASLFCSAAHATQPDQPDQPGASAAQPQASQPQHMPSDPTAEQAAGLTHAQVYAQLVQAEKDGSVARLNPYRHKEDSKM